MYVADHVNALKSVYRNGSIGKKYNIVAANERTNLDIVETVVTIFSELTGKHINDNSLITFVPDRLGHDFRYVIDASLIEYDLKWKCEYNFKAALRETVSWYLNEHSSSKEI